MNCSHRGNMSPTMLRFPSQQCLILGTDMDLVGWTLNPKPLYCGEGYAWTASDVFLSYLDELLGICVSRMFMRSKFSSVHVVSTRLYCCSLLMETERGSSGGDHHRSADHSRMLILRLCVRFPSSWNKMIQFLCCGKTLTDTGWSMSIQANRRWSK